ncbi:MAG: hypothetical protein M1479_09700 [Actinobacteria bacterium]|nr:hypothetical protein [Actinomycetota bacterium]
MENNSEIVSEANKRKINKVYIYEDVVRYNENGIEKIILFEGSVPGTEEGSLDTNTKFEHSGSQESILHVYVYAENGEVGHISFENPVNGFRSINIDSGGSGLGPDLWLGGITYEVFEF